MRTLDIFIKEGFEEFPNYTYGRATLAGIDEIILYPLKGIGMEIDSFNNLATDVMVKQYRIGENTGYYNAFYTGIMNFYLDFGIFGVVMFSILHGLFIYIVINKYQKHRDIYSLILLICVLNNLMLSILHWEYQAGSTTFITGILILINVFINRISRNSIYIKKRENVKKYLNNVKYRLVKKTNNKGE